VTKNFCHHSQLTTIEDTQKVKHRLARISYLCSVWVITCSSGENDVAGNLEELRRQHVICRRSQVVHPGLA